MFQPDKLADLLNSADVAVAPKPYTLESLIAWLETKPADGVYFYTDPGNCLIGQYLKEVCGFGRPLVGGNFFCDLDADLQSHPLPHGWDDIASGHPRTFGAALGHARATGVGMRYVLITCAKCGCEKLRTVSAVNRAQRTSIKLYCGRKCAGLAHRVSGGAGQLMARRVWRAMRARCADDGPQFRSYKGRGITVCARWEVFENFYADMGSAPTGLTIDRIDNDKGYFPGNCRWADREIQARNRTMARPITFDGRTQLLVDWSRELRINATTISMRLDRHRWSVERALTTPGSNHNAA